MKAELAIHAGLIERLTRDLATLQALHDEVAALVSVLEREAVARAVESRQRAQLAKAS